MATGTDSAPRGQPDVEQRERGADLSPRRAVGFIDEARWSPELREVIEANAAVIDTGTPDPWALNIAIAIVLLGIGAGFGFMGEMVWAILFVGAGIFVWLVGLIAEDA